MKRIFIPLAGITTLTAMAATAQASNYQVKQGDTIYTIAKETKTSVAELKQLNKLKNENVRPGQVLVVEANDYYRVKEGDTIQSIAKDNHITTFEVRFWNDLSSSKLSVGKKLIVSEKAFRKTKRDRRIHERTAPSLSPDTMKFINELKEEELQTKEATQNIKTNHIQIQFDEREQATSEDTSVDTNEVVQNMGDTSIENDVARIALRIAQGKTYVYGANTDKAVDCSSFAQQVFAAMGKQIPRTTYAQMAVGKKVSDPKPGDLVFFNNGSHVGVYIGNGQMIDALNPKEGVGLRAVDYISGSITGYYRY